MAKETAEEEEAEEELNTNEINLWVDKYDDLFSNFDSRPYTHKAWSVDFLEELKRASRDKPEEGTELCLAVKEKRDNKKEFMIKKRLHEHFKKHYGMLKQESNKVVGIGVLFIIGGIILMLVASYLLLTGNKSTFLYNFLTVLFEPGGWFLFWEGLRQVIFESRANVHEKRFNKKMISCNIRFKSV